MKLLFIITGSIAAIKCKSILKNLTNKGVWIDCILTNSAKKIVNKNAIQKQIKGRVYIDESEKKNKMLHIRLTRNSDLVVVCPATANIIAKFAHGYADDLASTSLIASDKQILFMPAMNVEMWNNKMNKKNVVSLQNNGVEFIGPDYGFLSCGEVGLGRLSNEKVITRTILEYLNKTKKLININCLVTAGPTREPIDPIRYISNYSSGKQGYAIAKQLMLSGAKVTLISGPTNISSPPNVKTIKVNTAKEMSKEVKKNLKKDVAIFTAAVTDFYPNNYKNTKIKKKNFNKIVLKKNPDIIKEVSLRKKKKPKLIIGFAAETENYVKNAKVKLIEKNCDLIILNKIHKKNKVFDSEFNKVTIISSNKIERLNNMSKINLAKILVNRISTYIN